MHMKYPFVNHCLRLVLTILYRHYSIICCIWSVYNAGSMQKFQSCYNKCAKLFFVYRRRDSVTGMLFDTGLPSVGTVLHNASYVFTVKWQSCTNILVKELLKLDLPYYFCSSSAMSVCLLSCAKLSLRVFT